MSCDWERSQIRGAPVGSRTDYGLVSLTPGYASLPVRGGDVSSLVRGEQLGGVYDDAAGRQTDALDILSAAGMNYARLRVWVDPVDGFDDEQQLLAGAREAKQHHLKLFLDFHYSDTWTDPGHQAVPAAWAGDSLPQLEAAVYSYSAKVVGDLAAQGTPPDMVQTGNEVNGGMLWPTGLDYGSSTAWPTFGALLKSAIAGVKAAAPRAKIVLHIANAANWGGVQWWYDNALAQGVPFDIVALSYYSYWHGYLDEFPTDPASGDGWENQAMFDYSDKALPVIGDYAPR